MAWIYSVVSEASPKPLLRGSPQSLTAKMTLRHSESYFVAWQAVNSTQLLSGTMSEHLVEDLSLRARVLTSLQAAFLARISQLRDVALVWQAREAASSLRSSAWPESSRPLSSSWKMFLRLEPGALTLSSPSLPPWGSMLGGRLSVPTSLVPLIGVRGGSSLLPTPTASEYGSGGHGAREGKQAPVLSLATMARHNLWPTPTRIDSTGRGYQLQPKNKKQVLTLPGAVKKFPTPTCMDSGNKPKGVRKKVLPGSGKVTGGQKPGLLEVLGSALNPRWVEGLMGYPMGWVQAGPWEVTSTRGKKASPAPVNHTQDESTRSNN